jgi:hypothetical protein
MWVVAYMVNGEWHFNTYTPASDHPTIVAGAFYKALLDFQHRTLFPPKEPVRLLASMLPPT